MENNKCCPQLVELKKENWELRENLTKWEGIGESSKKLQSATLIKELRTQREKILETTNDVFE
jgi:hypothetical protein